MPTRRRALLVILLLALVGLASLLAALAAGSLPVAPGDLGAALFGDATSVAAEVVRELRLPRALAAFACGGLLALAGALMQVLLRNPLADPYVLGISGGAAVGALLAMLLGLPARWCTAAPSPARWAPCCWSSAWRAATARGRRPAAAHRRHRRRRLRRGGGADPLHRARKPAARHAVLADGRPVACRSPGRRWPCWRWASLALPFARDLNLLARGDLTARALGVPVARLRGGVYVLASLATAAAVTTTGSVGFVGLIVPHLVRLAIGNDQRVLLPAAALAGGALLTLADTLARTVVAPQQLPVGVLTALIGVPVFSSLLTRSRRSV
jgi:iron complex transport system permease protein